jgi:hypothetical protein
MGVVMTDVAFLTAAAQPSLNKTLLRDSNFAKAKEQGLESLKVVVRPGKSKQGLVIAQYDSVEQAKSVNMASILRKVTDASGKPLFKPGSSTIFVEPEG